MSLGENHEKVPQNSPEKQLYRDLHHQIVEVFACDISFYLLGDRKL